MKEPTLKGRLSHPLTDELEALKQLETTVELTPYAKARMKQLKNKKTSHQ